MSDFWVGRYLEQNWTKFDKVGRHVRKNRMSDDLCKKEIEFDKRREKIQTFPAIKPGNCRRDCDYKVLIPSN
jgi:hypothetical protein